jgi:hypothetical protein
MPTGLSTRSGLRERIGDYAPIDIGPNGEQVFGGRQKPTASGNLTLILDTCGELEPFPVHTLVRGSATGELPSHGLGD